MDSQDDARVAQRAILTKFERREWFLDSLRSFLALDLNEDPSDEDARSELLRLHRMESTINCFQEQPYLLDPYLEEMVVPIIEALKSHVKVLVAANPEDAKVSFRFARVCSLLYTFIKFRGYKSIIRFFPHEVADLTIVLGFFGLPLGCNAVSADSHWEVFYCVMLWLSLVCMIPFDLDQFDEIDERGGTALAVEGIARRFLGRSGMEREGAALVLSRLYMRADTRDRLGGFLTWGEEITLGSTDLFLAIGVLQVVCEITKAAPSNIFQTHSSRLLGVARSADDSKGFGINAIIRKLRTKVVAHAGIRLLPPRYTQRSRKGKSLTTFETYGVPRIGKEEIDVPDEMEGILDDLFQAVQDKDTVVRWAAAKGIGAISERLPPDFSEQVLETVMGHFEIHSAGVTAIHEMPTIAEPTWQGACLTCAEMARRGLISDDHLPVLLGWMSKAIYFDIPKGSHSVGSSVRDAACYVLWSLARSHNPEILALHASDLAGQLINVALFDREVHVRRAASAAFQEHVGRTGLFPDGIDILRKADFHGVGTKRNAFLIAAPQIAAHTHYRPFLVDHIFTTTLRHWETEMRVLAAQSLREISELDLMNLGPENTTRAAKLLSCHDVNEIHGGLVALAELASSFKAYGLEQERQQVFRCLSDVHRKVLQGAHNEILLSATCDVIRASISSTEIMLLDKSSVPDWKSIVETGLRHRNVAVQESATNAFGSVSRLVDCSDDLARLIREFRVGLPSMQQSLGALVGVLDYGAFPHGLENALMFILESVDRKSPYFLANIEARRNCYDSLPLILSNVQDRMSSYISPKFASQCFDALLEGLTDYTTDERGDVGSWIRVSCVLALSKFIQILFTHSQSLSNFVEYLPPEKYHNAIGGILKQGVERLDNVRQQTGIQFLALLRLGLPDVDGKERWKIFGTGVMDKLFPIGEPDEWNNAAWLYPKAVHFLEIPEYRESVLMGLVLSLGTKTESTHRPVSSNLVGFVQELAPEGGVYPQVNLVGDLVKQLKRHFSNNNIFIPLLQTCNVLLESGALDYLNGSAEGEKQLRSILSVATRLISRIKNISRVQASMKVAVDMLAFPTLFSEGLEQAAGFLLHQYPMIRSSTAEYMYLAMQSRDLGRETDAAEEVLLETEWSVTTESELVNVTRKLLGLLS